MINADLINGVIIAHLIKVLVVGLSRIALGEFVSFCVPAGFFFDLSYPAVVHVSFLLCVARCCSMKSKAEPIEIIKKTIFGIKKQVAALMKTVSSSILA